MIKSEFEGIQDRSFPGVILTNKDRNLIKTYVNFPDSPEILDFNLGNIHDNLIFAYTCVLR